ncbi:MAG: DNA mismatch repair endonuclease MutL [Candidatus Margulisbacteria bacterium]|nr:DNA mismatch repair endonuclease MutL [Candidatus Margulisiibacteriota bacterium]
MSAKIHVLPEDLVNKIAAGEVVERPASVIKELVENSIDAGATQIIIEIQDAGKKLMRVSDNGSGLSLAEIELALQRHSTSKLSVLDDLFNIKTLGFRGEALPSIASVSRMKLEPNPAGAGLTVTVKDLFYNTPARKKFLKADSTEAGHIGDVIAKYVLANPQIAFRFIADGKPLISSPGTGRLTDAVLAIYGAGLLRELIELDQEFPHGRIFGLVSRPTLSRLDKNYETFFVNKRYIKNFLLNRALEEAYRTLIPNNRYPVGILFIDIDPKRVDVNVHPTKREIKFVNNQEVMDGVREAVKGALGDQKTRISGSEYQDIRVSGGSDWKPEMMEPFFSVASHDSHVAGQEIEMQISGTQPLYPIYQLKLTYIIATDGEELVLIDQHAAHERILYDQLSREPGVRSRESQTLLVPETIELSQAESAVLKSNLDHLNFLGFELNDFGSNSFLLRSVPSVSSKIPARQLILDIISDLRDADRSVQIEIRQENIRKYVACHSAVKAGDKLTQGEMSQLIRDLFATQNPLTCPHGRPTMVRLTEEELRKRFGR